MSIRSLVQETASNPGTGVTVQLAGPVASRRSFASSFSSGALAYYVLADGVQSEWGRGTFTAGSPNTLARTTVIGNSAGTTARLNFTGAVSVYNALPGEVVGFAGSDWGGIAGGTANALTAALPIAPPFRVPGRSIRCLIATTNTGAAQLNDNGLGLVDIRKRATLDALVAGDLVAGQVAEFLWDGTYHRLMTPVVPTKVLISPGAGAGLQLPTSPAGSYWKYFALQFDTTAGAFTGSALSNIGAAGAVLDAGTGGRAWICSAERVA